MSVQRKISFYRAEMAASDGVPAPPFNPEAGFAEIEAHPERSRYFKLPDGRHLRLWPQNAPAPRTAAMFGSVRTDALPIIDRVTSLDVLTLAAQEGVVEQTFLKVFDGRWVAVLRDQYGPGISRLGMYLRDRAPKAFPTDVSIYPLLSPDLARQLKQIDRLTLFELTTRDPDAIQGADQSLGKKLKAMYDEQEEGSVTARFSVDLRRKEKSLGQHLKSAAVKIAQLQDLPHIAERFFVVGLSGDGSRVEINVTNNRFVRSEPVPTTTRAITAFDAYSAIDRAYDHVKADLPQATVLRATATPN